MYTILIVVSFVFLAAKASTYVIAIFEKEHVRNDLEPRAYDAGQWHSDYLIEREAKARALGLEYCGSYFTAKHGSVVKGYVLLFTAPGRNLIVALVSARFGKIELEKTLVSSLFTDGTAVATCDQGQPPDYTGGIIKQTLYRAPLEELLAAHENALAATGRTPLATPSAEAFALYERIEYQRGLRLVAGGYGSWADPAQSKIRRTTKGVLATVRANRRATRQVIRTEMAKRNASSSNT